MDGFNGYGSAERNIRMRETHAPPLTGKVQPIE
jgi:hypothetical protein